MGKDGQEDPEARQDVVALAMKTAAYSSSKRRALCQRVDSQPHDDSDPAQRGVLSPDFIVTLNPAPADIMLVESKDP